MSDILKRVLCLVLALVVVFSFAGCRKSPVLEQTIYSQDAEVDPENQQTDNDEEHTEEDTTLPPRTTQQTASRQSEQTRVSAKPKSNPNNNNNRTNTTQGNQTQADSNQHNKGQNNPNPNNGNNNGSEGQGNTPGVNPDPNSGAINIDDKAPYDPSKIPENLEKVAAVGNIALYVEMLGGTGRLVATSENFKNNSFANRAFSDLGSVPQVWSSDGSGEMSDADFQTLLAQKPEAVLCMPGSLSQQQMATLDSQEIYVLMLSSFNTTSNIKANVQMLGTILGKPKNLPTAPDANKRAENYIKWMEDIIDRFPHPFSGSEKWNLDQEGSFGEGAEKNNASSDSGQYTLLIDGWDDSMNVVNDNGGAYIRTGYSRRNSPASYYLSLGGAANKAVINAPDLANLYPYYPAVPTFNEFNNSNVNNSWVRTTQGRTISQAITANLGSSNFNKVIVDSENTRISMANSYAWEVGIPQEDGTGHAYLNSIGADTQIVGPYEVLVNPSGIGSWTTGSPESPLEALWANEIFNNNQSEDGAFSAIRAEIEYFYSEFYGYNLQPSDMDWIKTAS